MHFGHIISGTLHFIFLLWLIMGDVFSSNFEPPDYDFIEITGATEEEWKASRDLAKSPVVVAQTEVTKPTPSFDDKLETKEPKIDKKVVELKPKVPKIPELPEDKIAIPKEIQLVDPKLSAEPEQPVINQETPLVTPLPETSETPSPVIADRVASAPVMPENEDAFNDDVIESLSQIPSDEDKPDLELEEKMQSTRGATTEIITEPKKKPSGAPKSSLQPKGRPQIQPDNEIKDTASVDLADAVSSALSGIENELENLESPDAASSGSPGIEVSNASVGNALLKQIEPCWNVDVGNQNAYVKVTVAFSLKKNGKIERNEIKLVASEGGDGSAVRSAFTNAKKTIFKCQKKWDGFNLQDFDYEQWQQIVLTFNPDQMRNR